jgi:hypothetical protein
MVRAVHLRVLPETRSECVGGVRPCPLVSCRYHLLLDVAEDGRLFVSRDIDEGDADSIVEALASMPETCALDVAERGGASAVEIGEMLEMHHKVVERTIREAGARVRDANVDWEEREHPEDFYIRYSNMGAAELAEIAAELRRKARRQK